MFLTYVLINITISMKCIWTISRFLTTLRNRINSVLVPVIFDWTWTISSVTKRVKNSSSTKFIYFVP
ncbi:hypothetical protein RIR_jg6223.t1 [Rhizophagus irregularis DAOM 181602=DAOM 197198]|uniref:MATA-HMG n=1 Tax=Rhizophagus irregularis TaxID=588596 RepID=A0A1B1ETR8_9GLOM|nr:MATA-HMG [Rhizophagus irregularis]ANQ32207.1 MATA-HMG [Rhizophagus irregularis]ANQ32208.1 MATA-HMG [Rhizophagus irregularis]ANQ32209.1 MATA-HMG [Rhizophagus irregularis]GET57574.1 hypothetical protein RIR_jg6223.t1 [Rhizophagus irregularis DAOM 181602=DAOM 197198]